MLMYRPNIILTDRISESGNAIASECPGKYRPFNWDQSACYRDARYRVQTDVPVSDPHQDELYAILA